MRLVSKETTDTKYTIQLTTDEIMVITNTLWNYYARNSTSDGSLCGGTTGLQAKGMYDDLTKVMAD